LIISFQGGWEGAALAALVAAGFFAVAFFAVAFLVTVFLTSLERETVGEERAEGLDIV
jgi:hypothetical protein